MYIMMPLKNWAALFYQLSRRYLDLDSVFILCSAGATNSIWVLMMRSSFLLASWTTILVPLFPVLVIENLMVSLSWVLAKYSCSLLRRADILFVSRLSLPWYSPCVSWSWCWPLNWVSPGYNGCHTMCTCLYNPCPGASDWHYPLWCCTSAGGSQRGQAWLVSRVLIEITDCSAQLHSWALFFIPILFPSSLETFWSLGVKIGTNTTTSKWILY